MYLKNISKSYGEKFIFNNLTYTFHKGDVYWLQGKNGVGKSTLLKLILGIESPDSGELDIPAEKLYIPEIPLVEDWLTPRENIDLLYKLTRLKQPQNIDWEKELEITSKDMNTLSIDCSLGTNMKIIFSLLFTETILDLIIIDESLSHIDQFAQHKILNKLIEYTQANESIIIFTHHDNLNLENSESKINQIILRKEGLFDAK